MRSSRNLNKEEEGRGGLKLFLPQVKLLSGETLHLFRLLLESALIIIFQLAGGATNCLCLTIWIMEQIHCSLYVTTSEQK